MVATNLGSKPLFHAISNKCRELGITMRTAAIQIRLTESYMRSLQYGNRSLENLSVKSFKHIAAFLDIPAPQAMLLAGVMQPGDFVLDDDSDPFEVFLRAVRTDPEIGPLLSHSEDALRQLPPQEKIAIMMIYERAFRTQVLKKIRPVALEAPDQTTEIPPASPE